MGDRRWSPLVPAAVVTAAVVAVLLTAAACSGRGTSTSASPRAGSDCASAKATEAVVRTERWARASDLPDLGAYLEIHWQFRALGICSWAPGPTDRQYQGVIRLRPQDAQALAARYDWRPVTPTPATETGTPNGPEQMWTSLTPFVPAGTRWLHSDRYDQADALPGRRQLYLAPDRALAFFVLSDS